MKNNRKQRTLYKMIVFSLCISQANFVENVDLVKNFSKTILEAKSIEKEIQEIDVSVSTEGGIENITLGSIVQEVNKTTEAAVTATSAAVDREDEIPTNPNNPNDKEDSSKKKQESVKKEKEKDKKTSKNKETKQKKELNNRKNSEINKKIALTLKQKGKKIIISWKKIAQAQQYAVYLKEGSKEKRLWKTLSKKQITISLTANIKYTVYVVAMNSKGKKLSKSEKCKILIPKKVFTVSTCSLEAKKVKITWKESQVADKYLIYRKVKTAVGYKKIGQSKKCRYLDREISLNKSYYYKIVPVVTLENRKFIGLETKKKFCNEKIVVTNHQKYSYTEMSKDITELIQKYSGIVQSKVIGRSEDGRNIYDVIVGNPNAKKTILVVAALHAREYMTSLLCMNQIEYYLENYYATIEGSSVSAVLNEIAIHYIPMANPDGVTIAQFGISNIRNEVLRQKLSKLIGSDHSLWKANARGVDLNKNFPYKFKKSGSAGGEGFTGRIAASERETRAIIELTNKLKKNTNLRGTINYHAMGSIVFGNCKSKSPVKEKTKAMYQLARNITGYLSASSYSSSTKNKGSAGNLREYFMYIEELPSITLEIGRNSCPGPIWEFPSIWSKNSSLVFKEAELLL